MIATLKIKFKFPTSSHLYSIIIYWTSNIVQDYTINTIRTINHDGVYIYKYMSNTSRFMITNDNNNVDARFRSVPSNISHTI